MIPARCVLVSVAAAALLVSLPAGATTRPPARVQVAADEFSFALSRAKILSGPAIVELANYGEDPHDLRFRRAGGTRTYAVATTAAGDYRDLSVKLLPGRYTLWCSIADHRKRGMVATLSVVAA